MERDPSNQNGRESDAHIARISTGLEHLQESDRRQFLIGGAAIIGTVLAQGLVGLAKKQSARVAVSPFESEAFNLAFETDACAYTEPCNLEASVVSPVSQVPATPHNSPPPVTMPPETTTTTAPPQPTPTSIVQEHIPVAQPIALQIEAAPSSGELKELPKRRMPYHEFANQKELMINNLPSLEVLNQRHGSSPFYADVERQLEHIAALDQAVQLDPARYHDWHSSLDLSRAHNSFRDLGVIDPKMVVWHWTGAHYNNVDEFVRKLGPYPGGRGLGVQAYVHSDGSAHQLTPTLRHKAKHALYMEDFSVGIEIYSGVYDEVNSPLFSYTTETVVSGLYMAMKMFQENKLPINNTTFLSHLSGDLIFVNPYYDPYTGAFHAPEGYKPPHMRKHDVIQEMTTMLLGKLQKLEAQLTAASS